MMALARSWWLVVLRGMIAILFGLATFLWPSITWLALILLFGIYAIVDGIVAISAGVMGSKYSQRWWMFLLEGMIGLAAGIIAILRPGLTSIVLIAVIASWAILTGILEIAAAIRLRREITNEWMLAFAGFVSIVLGVLLFFQPATGGLVITLMIGAYALIFGIMLVVLGFRLRKWNVPPQSNDRGSMQYVR
jgi:uncharacterized membrane protein HdeD (DUF308 family)